jgi:hypothetical protein
MKRASFFVGIAFLAGFGIGFLARGTGSAARVRHGMRAAGLAAIDRLHKADVAPTLMQDRSALSPSGPTMP